MGKVPDFEKTRFFLIFFYGHLTHEMAEYFLYLIHLLTDKIWVKRQKIFSFFFDFSENNFFFDFFNFEILSIYFANPYSY